MRFRGLLITKSNRTSSDDARDQLAVDVGETEIPALVAEGEFLVVEAELVEQRGLEIVDADRILGGTVVEFVGLAVGVARLETATGDSHGIAGTAHPFSRHRSRHRRFQRPSPGKQFHLAVTWGEVLEHNGLRL